MKPCTGWGWTQTYPASAFCFFPSHSATPIHNPATDSARAEAIIGWRAGGKRHAGGSLRNATREDDRLLRSELRDEIAELRTEMKAGFVIVGLIVGLQRLL